MDQDLTTRERGRLAREVAAQEHTDPFGRQVRVARGTPDRWTRRDRAGGFDALVPEPSAGLALVRAVLAAIPQTVVWRMTAADYTASLYSAPFEPGVLDAACLGETSRDPAFAAAMRAGEPEHRRRPAGRPALTAGGCRSPLGLVLFTMTGSDSRCVERDAAYTTSWAAQHC